MNPRSILILVTGLSLLIIISVVGAYVINFHNFPISNDTQIWGTFGDYFGGVLNPIIGVLNLLILVYITFQISQIETKRNEQELSNQKEFAIYSLRHDALKELNKILERVQPELVKSDKDSELLLVLIRNDIHAFINTQTFLFPTIDDKKWHPITESILEISKLAGRQYKSGYALDMETEIRPKLEKFNELKIDILENISKLVIT